MKKLIFGILCILGSAWGPEYKVSYAITSEELIKFNSQEPLTFQGLCAAVQQVQPDCVFEGIPIMPPNAKLLIDSTILDKDNATQLLTGNDLTIMFVRTGDRICLPMVGCEDISQDLVCTLTLDFKGNIGHATAVRKRASAFYGLALQRMKPNTIHNTFLMKSGHCTSFLRLINPHLQSIILCFTSNDLDITVIQNPNLEVTIGSAHHELTLVPNPNLGRKCLPHRQLESIYRRWSWLNISDLSFINQNFLDSGTTPDNPSADSTWSPAGSWVIQE